MPLDDPKGRVFLVDNDEKYLSSTADSLKRYGFSCDCVCNIVEAERKLREQCEYDVMICDIWMPGNYNLEFIREALGLRPALPIVLMTGYPTLDTAVLAVELPVVGYLIKPVELGKLISRLNRSVDVSRRQRSLLQSLSELQPRLEAVLWRVEGMNGTSDAGSLVGLRHELAGIWMDIRDLLDNMQRIADTPSVDPPCQVCAHRQPGLLLSHIARAVNVLEQTKRAFKSKQLGELRKSLQNVLELSGNSVFRKDVDEDSYPN